MVNVVLDTNIIISAAISADGNPAHIFELLVHEEIHNFTTQDIIDEIREVLQRDKIAKRLGLAEREFVIGMFEKFSEKIVPLTRFDKI